MKRKDKPRPKLIYSTSQGSIYHCSVETFLKSKLAGQYKGKVQLLLTSPPFPLNHKKKYGNLQGEAYLKWLADFAPAFRKLLAPSGSIVLELGNAWEPGRPVMSTLALEALLAFKKKGRLRLVQQFVAHNPARLPSPAQWVNVERIRVKDSYTHLWWLAPSDRPYANNRSVLTEYSGSMRSLLKAKTYNAGTRPSGHRIGKKSFLKNNGGSIPSNVLVFSNTASTDKYQEYCRTKKLKPHPARMQTGIVEFFVNFLTRTGDLVFDPFAGSNTTGACAEGLERAWISVEAERSYITCSRGRFSRGKMGAAASNRETGSKGIVNVVIRDKG
jgi:site-specific DNA-methyltransferase (cytosine-N4-specific)